MIVKGILSKQKGKGSVLKDIEKLFVKNIPPQNVIFYEEKTIKTGTFFKLIQKQGEVFLFPAFNKRELKTWMKIEVEKENYSFEKEVIDIILDIYLRRDEYKNTIYIIDEPELHLNTAIQTFPTNIMAGYFRFEQEKFFEVANESEKEPVKVQF